MKLLQKEYLLVEVLTRDTELFKSGEDGYKVGELVAKYLKKYLY